MTRVLLIAEAGVNHNGDPELALRLVDAAADAGADVVKFQTFRAEALAAVAAPTAGYQAAAGEGASQLAMLRRLELSQAAHRAVVARCRERGIAFLSSPFDAESLAFLVDGLGLGRIKLGSGELTNGPLLLAAARSGRPVILSTGMGDLAEVAEALGVLAHGYAGRGTPSGRGDFAAALADPAARALLAEKVVLLHCTTQYPAPVDQANLAAMATMRHAFGVPVGYSDHTPGTAVAIAAAALGAVAIEKHFTLDRSLPGPDHAASLEPGELAAMIADIRAVERAIGDGVKQAQPAELANVAVARKSLVAARPIAAGEVIGPDAIAAKRVGGGLSPMEHWRLIGSVAGRAYAADEPIEG